MDYNVFGKVEWVIHLKGNRMVNFDQGDKQNGSPPLNIVVKAKETLPAIELLEEEKEALKSLKDIAETCKEIRGDCIEALAHQEDKQIEERAADVSKNLNGLYKIILEFSKLLKRFGKPDESSENTG